MESSRVSITDVVWAGGTLANVRAMDSNLRRVRFSDVRATGSSLAGATLEDVRFAGCRLDLSNLRMTKLERVRFEGCWMEEADFYHASLRCVVFDDCTLTGANWSGATFERSEMRGTDLRVGWARVDPRGADAMDRRREIGERDREGGRHRGDRVADWGLPQWPPNE